MDSRNSTPEMRHSKSTWKVELSHRRKDARDVCSMQQINLVEGKVRSVLLIKHIGGAARVCLDFSFLHLSAFEVEPSRRGGRLEDLDQS